MTASRRSAELKHSWPSPAHMQQIRLKQGHVPNLVYFHNIHCMAKIAPFYFCNNFVKLHCILIIKAHVTACALWHLPKSAPYINPLTYLLTYLVSYLSKYKQIDLCLVSQGRVRTSVRIGVLCVPKLSKYNGVWQSYCKKGVIFCHTMYYVAAPGEYVWQEAQLSQRGRAMPRVVFFLVSRWRLL